MTLTNDGEHGGHGLVHGLHFDHRRVIDGDLLEGQRVDLSLIRHVDHLARVQTDVVFVPGHRDLVMGEFNAELGCFALLHRHVLDRFDELQADTCRGKKQQQQPEVRKYSQLFPKR